MPTKQYTPEALDRIRRGGRKGGFRRAIVLTDKQLSEIGRKAIESRWAGLTPEERKIERARGRTPKAPAEPHRESEPKTAAAGA